MTFHYFAVASTKIDFSDPTGGKIEVQSKESCIIIRFFLQLMFAKHRLQPHKHVHIIPWLKRILSCYSIITASCRTINAAQ